MRAPDVVGEVVAFRAWRVETGWRRATLRSLDWTFWPTGAWLHAECDKSCGDIPGEDCACGIYAAKHREHLYDIGYMHRSGHREPVVFGEVGLAGKIVPGTLGWRAARARPLRVFVPHEHWELVAPLRAYGVPVLLSNPFERS